MVQKMMFLVASFLVGVVTAGLGGEVEISNGDFVLRVSDVTGEVVYYKPTASASDVMGGRVGQVYVSDESSSEENQVRGVVLPTYFVGSCLATSDVLPFTLECDTTRGIRHHD